MSREIFFQDVIVQQLESGGYHCSGFLIKLDFDGKIHTQDYLLEIFLNERSTNMIMFLSQNGFFQFWYSIKFQNNELQENIYNKQDQFLEIPQLDLFPFEWSDIDEVSVSLIQYEDILNKDPLQQNTIFTSKIVSKQMIRKQLKQIIQLKPVFWIWSAYYWYNDACQLLLQQYQLNLFENSPLFQSEILMVQTFYPSDYLLNEIYFSERYKTFELRLHNWNKYKIFHMDQYYIPYWPKNNFIIFDIDGTFTRSDLLGHIFGVMNLGYLHKGVIAMLNLIIKQNYMVIFLSSRPITLFKKTKNLLFNTQQNGERLQKMPVFTSNNNSMQSLSQELIEKTSCFFKLQQLLPLQLIKEWSNNIFYAGFGNQINDYIAYKLYGISTERIYIINKSSKIKLQNETKIDYEQISQQINKYFPKF